MSLLRRGYGAGPVHLAAHALAFAAFGWVILQVIDIDRPLNVLLWFVGAFLLHDLVLLPFYAGLDRVSSRLTGPRAALYVRVPLAFSGLLLLVWLPTILDRNDGSFARVAGYEAREGALGAWLVATAVLCVISGALWVLRGRRAAASPPPGR